MSFRAIRVFLCVALTGAGALAAQTPTGRIVGRVIEESTGAPISGAQVGIAAGGRYASSGIDGRYTLLDVPAGAIALAVRAIGYSPKTVSGVIVPAGGVVGQDITMTAQTVQLVEINVAAAAERGTVAAALDEQRHSSSITNAVTAEEIARSPDGDAGQAVARVSGVTVQDGRYVFVRGLGERYTTTSLNNARIPSPEPERKVVPLDLFPSSLLEAVTTSKTFTPDQSGDFSGARVDIRTREFPLGRILSIGMSAGANDAVTGARVPLAPRTGSEWLGFAGSARDLPASVAAAGDLSGTPPSAIPGLIGSFRDVWNASTGTGGLAGATSIALGGEDPVFGHLLGYLGSFTYGYSTDLRRNEQRAIAVDGGNGTTRPQNEYAGTTGTASVLWGGIVNLTTRLGTGTKLTFNNTFSRGADNQATRLAGHNEEFDRTLDLTRLSVIERSVRSSQLAGQHLIGAGHLLNWAVTSSGVGRREPDRSDLAYDAVIGTNGSVLATTWAGIPRAASRTFSDLHESSWEGSGSWQFSPRRSSTTSLKIGGTWRTVDRSADTRAYDIVNYRLDDSVRALPASQVFTHTADLLLVPVANGGRYTAADRLTAGFLQIEFPLSARLRIIGGARVEHAQITVDTRATDGTLTSARLDNTDVLPALSLTAQLTRTQQLRLSASQTLSRPEYRELSGVTYYDILGGFSLTGNRNLRRALIQNYDIRWEMYPSPGEIVSVSLFAKRFQDPIERILVATTGATTIGFVNAESAHNYGVEVEVRRSLAGLGLTPLSVFTNATIMTSSITPGADSISSLSSAHRPMVGQSPYVFNAGLGYAGAGHRTTATLLYNVTGRRIVEAGTLPLPDTWEQPRHVVDASARRQIGAHTSLKLDIKNLLDAPFRVTQGDVTRSRYTIGRTVTMGVTWEP